MPHTPPKKTRAQLRGRRLLSSADKRKGRPGAMEPGSAGRDPPPEPSDPSLPPHRPPVAVF